MILPLLLLLQLYAATITTAPSSQGGIPTPRDRAAVGMLQSWLGENAVCMSFCLPGPFNSGRQLKVRRTNEPFIPRLKKNIT